MTRMTSSRFGRTGRGRLIMGLGAIVLTVMLVFVKLHLDEARRMETQCEYQQVTLNIQLADLQKTLKMERSNYERQSQKQFDLKARAVQESNMKLISLQQHYKLLQNQYDDSKEECTKDKLKQVKKMKTLLNKLDSLEKNYSCIEKDKDIELWKMKYFKLFNAKHVESVNSFDNAWLSSGRSTKETVLEKNFNAQIAVNNKFYSIPVTVTYKKYSELQHKNVKNTTIPAHEVELSTISSLNNPLKPNEQEMKFPNGVVPIPFEPNIQQAIHSSEKLKVVQKNIQNEVLGAFADNENNYENEAKALSHISSSIDDDDNRSKNADNKFSAIANDVDFQGIQQHNDILANAHKLKNEINEDQGKVYADEMNFQVEDEDDDEYTDHRHIRQGQAVRERR